MPYPEYHVVEESSAKQFVAELNRLARLGFTVVSSNTFYIKDERSTRHSYEDFYYALMVKN